ncbi:MAG TPA: hypothetical protein VJ783_04785 [Pirellulales bacterium]|nr:hypothetical protein [Pirellulales bacterium]
MAVADLKFGDQEKIGDAKGFTIAKDEQGSAARRMEQKIAVRHVQCPTIGQMDRERNERSCLMDRLQLLDRHSASRYSSQAEVSSA